MIVVEKSVLVGYSAQQMFDLVAGVERYPEFLPWCGGSSVTRLDEQRVTATVQIDYRGLKQRFTTDNLNCPPERIEMKLHNGPFRHLEGSWRFMALNETACKILFALQYEFSSKMLETLVNPVFSHIANSFVDAFVKRAEEVYGES